MLKETKDDDESGRKCAGEGREVLSQGPKTGGLPGDGVCKQTPYRGGGGAMSRGVHPLQGHNGRAQGEGGWVRMYYPYSYLA